tara:strand:- start:20256 stop:20918 length:663 start_codon:yes stop_codon:yes gene_type:complete
MAGQKSLKSQNAWLIRSALVLHALAFAFVAFEPFVLIQLDRADVLEKLKEVLAPGSLSLAIIAITKLILLGLIPANVRDRLVHWRWRNPLPGTRAFSKIGPADTRVNMTAIEQEYGASPVEPKVQNTHFYRIYMKHSDSIPVLDAHKSYLAARDICVISFLMFLLLPWFAYWITSDLFRTGVYASTLIAAYCLTARSAQVYSQRLVENSLAAESVVLSDQ